MTFMTTVRGRLGRENPCISTHRSTPTIAVAIAIAVLASACQSPTDGARAASATAPHINATVTGGSASFSVHAGTLTSSGAFITGNGSFLPCGVDTVIVPDGFNLPAISSTDCGPPTLNTTGGVELDGGFVSVDYATPRDTGSVADIEGDWRHRVDVFYPTSIAAVLTATPYAGYHLADWEITGPNGVRLVDSLTIVRPPNSQDTQYIVFFQQGTGSGGTGTGGTGGGGGGGGTCLHNCPPPK